MADVHDKATRSYNMSRVKNKNTKPEIIVRKFLHSKGFRFRLHDKNLPGKPDIILSKYKTVIFINGCFWHGHENCKYFTVPKTNSEWWKGKINGNIKNDVSVSDSLKKEGWKIIVIWTCQLKPKQLEGTLSNLESSLKSQSSLISD